MTIYTIYQIINKINNKSYVGFTNDYDRRRNDHRRQHQKDDTNKLLYRAMKKHGFDNFEWRILYQSLDHEHTLTVMENYFILDTMSHCDQGGYNLSLGGEGTRGIFAGKDQAGEIVSCSVTDEAYLSGQVRGVAKNTVPVKDSNGEYFRVDLQDPKYLSGELKHTSSGFVTVVDAAGSSRRVPIDDKAYISGDLKHIRSGYIAVKDSTGQIKDVQTEEYYCRPDLHCISSGTIIVLNADGTKTRMSVEDPRYRSGEAIPLSKNNVTVMDKNGRSMRVCKTDPRYLSGELSGVTKGQVTVKDSEGNTFNVFKDDPRYLSGELSVINKGRVCARTTDGRKVKVDKNDPGFKMGLLTLGWSDK